MSGWLAWLALALAPSWQVEGCPEDLDTMALAELTALEAGPTAEEASFCVKCREDAYVLEVRIDADRVAGRVVPRGDVASDAVERQLALELAELFVGAGYVEHDAWVKQPLPSPVAPPKPRAEPRGLVVAAGRFELGGTSLIPAGGGSVSLIGRVAEYVSLRAEVAGLGGGRTFSGAQVVSMAGWAATSVLATFDRSRATVDVGGGVRVGGRWFRGVADRPTVDGRTHGGLTWSPVVTASVRAPRRTRVAMLASIDAGWTLRPIRGFFGEDLVVSSGGPWIGVSLGVGARFGR